jgi:hypothetical protein
MLFLFAPFFFFSIRFFEVSSIYSGLFGLFGAYEGDWRSSTREGWCAKRDGCKGINVEYLTGKSRAANKISGARIMEWKGGGDVLPKKPFSYEPQWS